MKSISCPHEGRVSNSANTGHWDDFLKAHIKECVHCSKTAAIAKHMGSIAGTIEEDYVLPEAEHVWLNARLAAIQEESERALHPLMIAEFAIKATIALVLAAGIVWIWFGLRSLAANSLSPFIHIPQSVLVSSIALATGLIALLFTKLAQPILIEE